MKNKKTFLMYQDIEEVVDKLTDKQAGQLLKAMFDFNRGDTPKLDNLLDLVFTPIKNSFLRNNEKWERELKLRSDAGKKGMEARWHNKSITKDKSVIIGITKITDSVSVPVPVSVILGKKILEDKTEETNPLLEKRLKKQNKKSSFNSSFKKQVSKQVSTESLKPLTNLQIWEIADEMNVAYKEVARTHKSVLLNIEGNKYNITDTKWQVKAWVNSSISRGDVEEIFDKEERSLNIGYFHPDEIERRTAFHLKLIND